MLPICEWSIGIGCAAGGEPCFTGMVMPFAGFAPTFFAGAAAFAFFFGVAFFFGAFFFTAVFAGIGMVMPGMDCAAAGAQTFASASALAARYSSTLTINLREEEAPR
jgi:hypothetical protein